MVGRGSEFGDPTHQVHERTPQQRLAAGQPDLTHAQPTVRRSAGSTRHPKASRPLAARAGPPRACSRCTWVPVRHRNPQIARHPPEGVDRARRRAARSAWADRSHSPPHKVRASPPFNSRMPLDPPRSTPLGPACGFRTATVVAGVALSAACHRVPLHHPRPRSPIAATTRLSPSPNSGVVVIPGSEPCVIRPQRIANEQASVPAPTAGLTPSPSPAALLALADQGGRPPRHHTGGRLDMAALAGVAWTSACPVGRDGLRPRRERLRIRRVPPSRAPGPLAAAAPTPQPLRAALYAHAPIPPDASARRLLGPQPGGPGPTTTPR